MFPKNRDVFPRGATIGIFIDDTCPVAMLMKAAW